jgi:pimeloyl-ACP methyl ester carboxylesterase
VAGEPFHPVATDSADPLRPANLLPVPYDWRLSNRFNARRLKGIVEPALERWRALGGPRAEARLIFICHSMGGLIARRYVDLEGGAALTRKLITIGTPHRGALSALDQLLNGVSKGIGPLALDLTAFARSLPSIHQLLPEYACIASPGSPSSAQPHRDGLLKTTETSLPELDGAMVRDAMAFHQELDGVPCGAGYDLHPIVGSRQPTRTTGQLSPEGFQASLAIGGEEQGGDGTVPQLAAIPKTLRPDSPTIHYVADQHGALQSNRAVFDELMGILTARPRAYRASDQIELGIEVEPLLLAGEPLKVRATVAAGERVGLEARLLAETGRVVEVRRLRLEGDQQSGHLLPPGPGAYGVEVGGVGTASARVAPVRATVLVWPAERQP